MFKLLTIAALTGLAGLSSGTEHNASYTTGMSLPYQAPISNISFYYQDQGASFPFSLFSPLRTQSAMLKVTEPWVGETERSYLYY